MKYNITFSIPLEPSTIKEFGINEDTIFETYMDDGEIKVRILDESDLDDCPFFESDETDNFDLDNEDDCYNCLHYCHKCDSCNLKN